MRHHDLLIIGTGSGNSVIGPEHDHLDIAIVERDRFGGTCLLRGCIPSKMFVYAADVAELARRGPQLGVDTRMHGADWKAIRDRVFDRIDPISDGGEEYRDSLDNVTVYRGNARFVGERTITVAGETISADQVVLAAGARPNIPDVPGLDQVGYHTSDTIMRIDEMPEHLVIFGGGYIASEMAHVFGALGSRVTIVTRGDTLLRFEDDDIRMRFTECTRRRFDTYCNSQVLAVRRAGGDAGGDTGVEVDLSVDGVRSTIRGDLLLVATGRTPNSAQLGVDVAGVDTDAMGFVVTDEHLRTSAPGVWALGDICNPDMLKHAANADARVVAHNVVNPADLRAVDRRFMPHAVFGFPQVASVGATERHLLQAGVPIRVAVQPFGATAYGWAMEDTEGLCKVIAHADTRQLLGAHLVGPQASTLVQQLIQGMRFGLTVDQMAREQYYIHPALTEVVEQALLAL